MDSDPIVSLVLFSLDFAWVIMGYCFPQPKNLKNIKHFLGLAGYYRRFINDFSAIAKSLTNLLKKTAIFKWREDEEKSFKISKQALCSSPILQ